MSAAHRAYPVWVNVASGRRPVDAITPSFGTAKVRTSRPAPAAEPEHIGRCPTMIPGKGRCMWPAGHGTDHDPEGADA